jgi:ubiquinone/menaquinone biosynthesis C-methylase UbiE
MEFFFDIHKDLPREGPGNNETTRKAFSFLNDLPHNPLILDVGCGPGMQTIQLAKLIEGKIIALDNHQPFLDQLKMSAEKEGVAEKIETVNKSMFSMDFEDTSFDVIWSEGAIYIYGFEKALVDWKRLLRKDGYFVGSEFTSILPDPPKEASDFLKEVYPDIKTITQNLETIRKAGYSLIKYLHLPKSGWEDYFIPIEARTSDLKKKYQGNKEALDVIDAELREMHLLRKYYEYHDYIFYIMQIK